MRTPQYVAIDRRITAAETGSIREHDLSKSWQEAHLAAFGTDDVETEQ